MPQAREQIAHKKASDQECRAASGINIALLDKGKHKGRTDLDDRETQTDDHKQADNGGHSTLPKNLLIESFINIIAQVHRFL